MTVRDRVAHYDIHSELDNSWAYLNGFRFVRDALSVNKQYDRTRTQTKETSNNHRFLAFHQLNKKKKRKFDVLLEMRSTIFFSSDFLHFLSLGAERGTSNKTR